MLNQFLFEDFLKDYASLPWEKAEIVINAETSNFFWSF